MSLKIKLWGIRGSLPAPMPPDHISQHVLKLLEQFEHTRISNPKNAALTPSDFLKTLPTKDLGGFGGHTACIEVKTNSSRIIIDGGSGLRRVGDMLMREEAGLGRAKIHILMTHFHWDHLIGLPFFTPIFVPGNEIHFYAVQSDLEENIRRMFCKPNFPVEFDKLSAKIFFHQLAPRQQKMFGDISVAPYQLDHPDPCWGYRIEHNGKSFAYCVDSECIRVSREQLGADLPLYQNVDLMVFDAQYTFMEAAERINWGHASGPIGVDLAMREKVKQLLFIHHDPAASDQKIKQIELQTREYYQAALKAAEEQDREAYTFDWSFAYEGQEVDL